MSSYVYPYLSISAHITVWGRARSAGGPPFVGPVGAHRRSAGGVATFRLPKPAPAPVPCAGRARC
eukprot:2226-Lingulodinium_polyedra.AAC.1